MTANDDGLEILRIYTLRDAIREYVIRVNKRNQFVTIVVFPIENIF